MMRLTKQHASLGYAFQLPVHLVNGAGGLQVIHVRDQNRGIVHVKLPKQIWLMNRMCKHTLWAPTQPIPTIVTSYIKY